MSRIRKSLKTEDTKTVVNALVTPHLDYGNALLYGIAKRLENKLQIAQNSAARLIHKIDKREHITTFRKQLHWLPIPARIQYKILTLTWKVLNDQGPLYLKNLVTVRHLNRTLRTNERLLLDIPNSISHSKVVDRSFSRAAPKLWNQLPDNLRCIKTYETFKKNLKTHLFRKYYD
jgi:hypothetical protein